MLKSSSAAAYKCRLLLIELTLSLIVIDSEAPTAALADQSLGGPNTSRSSLSTLSLVLSANFMQLATFVLLLNVPHIKSLTFLAVQDSSISDIVCPLVGRSEPTNNQSLGSIKE